MFLIAGFSAIFLWYCTFCAAKEAYGLWKNGDDSFDFATLGAIYGSLFGAAMTAIFVAEVF